MRGGLETLKCVAVRKHQRNLSLSSKQENCKWEIVRLPGSPNSLLRCPTVPRLALLSAQIWSAKGNQLDPISQERFSVSHPPWLPCPTVSGTGGLVVLFWPCSFKLFKAELEDLPTFLADNQYYGTDICDLWNISKFSFEEKNQSLSKFKGGPSA